LKEFPSFHNLFTPKIRYPLFPRSITKYETALDILPAVAITVRVSFVSAVACYRI
jgi:hypothetical protein